MRVVLKYNKERWKKQALKVQIYDSLIRPFSKEDYFLLRGLTVFFLIQITILFLNNILFIKFNEQHEDCLPHHPTSSLFLSFLSILSCLYNLNLKYISPLTKTHLEETLLTLLRLPHLSKNECISATVPCGVTLLYLPSYQFLLLLVRT